MEAMWTRCFPAMLKLREWMDGGALGQLKQLTADFSYRSTPEEKPRLFDPTLGGGALLDVGIYTVALASWAFGPPVRISSQAHVRNGVDELCAMTFSYANGSFAQLSAGIVVEAAQEAILSGTEGRVRVHKPWWQPSALTLSRPSRPDEQAEFSRDGNGLHYEAIEVMRCVADGHLESPGMPLDETLSIARTMDALRAQWGLRYPMEQLASGLR